MAIVIPSSKTYNRQNPKVRDNVIERIEVGAVEITPNNEYETHVYNQKFSNLENSLIDKSIDNKELDASTKLVGQSGISARYYSVSYVAYNNQKSLIANLKIPVVENNKWINYIFTKLNEEKKENIKYTIKGIVKKGTAYANWDYTATGDNITITEGVINYSNPTSVSDITNLEFEKEISISETSFSPTVASKATQTLIEWGNIKTATTKIETIDNKEYYSLQLEIMASVRNVKMSYTKHWLSSSSATYPSTIDLTGEYAIYEPKEIEITLYGNTIGIDLTDKTVYIPETDKTSKKVHSVDGNEIMQTSNYYQSTDTNAIRKAFTQTQTDYTNGKETATIRCSVNDYFDYDSKEKIISIDNYTNKMSFKIGDQVIPMVYGADGQDKPISTYQNGSPKVFQVLGSNIFYDGAVWQELSLQEV